MKNFHLVLCTMLLLAITTSCRKVTGKGPVVVESRNTTSFNGLVVNVAADTYFTQDSIFKVELHAQENILDQIETTVINNNLQIRYRHSGTRIHSNDGVKIYVSGPAIRSLNVDGSGYLEATNAISPANLQLRIGGSGNIRINNVNTAAIDAEIDGSGHINVVSGTANEAVLRISGSGLIDNTGITVKDASATIRGSGNIKVFATQTLRANITGSGSIVYRGTPAVTTSISGSGTVRPQ